MTTPAPAIPRYLHALISIAVTVVLIAYVFVDVSLDNLLGQLALVRVDLIAVYVILSVFSLFVRTVRASILLSRMSPEKPPISFAQVLAVNGIRNALVDLLPARLGEASFVYYLKRFGVGLDRGVATLGVSFLLDVAVLSILLAVFLALTPFFLASEAADILGQANGSLLSRQGISIAAGLFAVAVSLCLIFSDRLLGRIVLWTEASSDPDSWRGWSAAGLRSVRSDLAGLRANGAYLPSIVLTAVLRTAKYGALYVLLIAVLAPFGYGFTNVDPILTTVAFVGAEASASLPVGGIMGFGAYEGAWSFIFSASKLRLPSIVAVIFAVHVISQFVSVLIGLFGLLLYTSLKKSPASA